MFSMASLVNTSLSGCESSDVLVDEPFDVELAKNRSPTRRVEAEHAEVFVGLTLRVLVLRLVDALVLGPNEPRIQNPGVLAPNSRDARLAIGRSLPLADQERQRLQGVGRGLLR
jgi:hypothetical protein